MRCDRQLPCQTCTNKGIGLLCTYMPGGARKTKASVGDRIRQLEELVRTLAQQPQQGQAPPTSAVSLESALKEAPASWVMPVLSPQGTPRSPEGVAPSSSAGDDTDMPSSRMSNMSHTHSTVSPPPSEYGSIRLHPQDATYMGTVHWTAVLDSISELKDHYEQEEEARMLTVTDHAPSNNPGPRLLYEPTQSSRADILASIPARPAVDRLVAKYFNTPSYSPLPIIHSGRFLRQV